MSNLARAYSFIEIKSADDDRRIIEGVATTPTPDRSQDIVRPMGAKFSLPLPFLWQHRHDEPIGHVIDADPKPSGIKFKAQIQKTDEPGKLKDRLDEAWLSLKLKLVRATSIGFRPLKYSFIENGGIDFEEWDWLELSGVTIPANPDAAITAVKQFDRIFREAQGIPDLEILHPEAPATSGKTRVVKLDDHARVGAKPFVINRIVRR
ncbi:HK97 family phage prohead protease [Sphingobium yanoikuyae]|uniref:HK97 family phage prohead protease n=1 Tax=Sphingobium yanoikuyae TaxID=13690 RepID=UPI0035C7C89E